MLYTLGTDALGSLISQLAGVPILPVTLHEWAPVSGTRTGSVRSQASELYSSSWKLEPVADDCTDAAHTEMLRSVQCCRLNLHTDSVLQVINSSTGSLS